MAAISGSDKLLANSRKHPRPWSRLTLREKRLALHHRRDRDDVEGTLKIIKIMATHRSVNNCAARIIGVNVPFQALFSPSQGKRNRGDCISIGNDSALASSRKQMAIGVPRHLTKSTEKEQVGARFSQHL